MPGDLVPDVREAPAVTAPDVAQAKGAYPHAVTSACAVTDGRERVSSSVEATTSPRRTLRRQSWWPIGHTLA